MVSRQKKNPVFNNPEYKKESRHALQERFSNPIVKVSLNEGVLVNRLQSFWNNENIKTLDKTAS